MTLAYDPLGRLYQVTGASGTRRFIYDGTDRVGDADTVGNWVANYVYGPGEDAPIVVHAQPAPVYLSSDERGSIISQSLDVTGAVVAINRYDEFGQPQSTNAGTFGYTGQAWIPDLKLWYYKARIYSPALGRFMQTDPIGYGSGPNIYAYVRGDPVNLSDPLGLSDRSVLDVKPTCYVGDACTDEIFVNGQRLTSCGIFCSTSDPQNLIVPPMGPRYIGPGGAASSGSPKAPSEKPKPKPSTTCQSVAQQPGKVSYTGATATLAELLGVTGSVGRFVNLQTGAHGYYYIVGGGVGEEAAVGGGGGIASSMGAFLGLSGNISGAGGGASGNFSFNQSGTGVGANGTLGLGASATLSYTGIFHCSLGG